MRHARESGFEGFVVGQGSGHLLGRGVFKVCGNSATINEVPFVVYVNGTRTAGTISLSGCSALFDPGAGGDFQVSFRRAQIFGTTADTPSAENSTLFGFSQF